MARSLTLDPMRQRIIATVCLLAFVTVSLCHIAHNLDYGQKHSGKSPSIYAASIGVCPACVALHSSSAETPYECRQSELPIRFSPAISYQGPAVPGVSLPFFVRPPPTA